MSKNYSKEQNKEYMKNYRKKRKLECVIKLGNCCKVCGTKDNLEFDHIDSNNKKFNISDFSKSKIEIDKELIKCQILCHSCHVKKSIMEGSFVKSWTTKPRGVKHGTHSGYTRYKCRCNLCIQAKKNTYLPKEQRV